MSDTDALNGIRIPDDLAAMLVPIESVRANPWNPNHMDPFMRDKLVKAIRKDGFILPVLVRPMKDPEKLARGQVWEIIDGEHRWSVADTELQMKMVPVLNLGDISDSEAKAMTIKANTLRGEFDSVQLAGMVDALIRDYGKDQVIEDLPYTPERIQSMQDLINTDVNALSLADPNSNAPSGPSAGEGEGQGAAASNDQFKSFDPSTAKLDHKCPRCGFEFNDPKVS